MKKNLDKLKLTENILKFIHSASDVFSACETILKMLSKELSLSNAILTVWNEALLSYENIEYSPILENITVYPVTNENMSGSYPLLKNVLDNQDFVFFDKVHHTMGCKEDFEKIGCQNILIAAVFSKSNYGRDKKSFITLVGKDENSIWCSDIIEFIITIFGLINSMLVTRNSSEKLAAANRSFDTIIDNLNSAICVAHIDSHVVFYTNQSFCSIFGKNSIGRTDIEIFGNSIMSSEASDFFRTAQVGDSTLCEEYLEKFEMWVNARFKIIKWLDGQKAILITIDDITPIVSAKKQLDLSSRTDDLTGLSSRRCMELDFPEIILRSQSCLPKNCIAAMLDIDDLKSVNESCGIKFTDSVIQSMALFLDSLCKDLNCRVYRFGSDEFIIYIIGKTNEQIDDILDKILCRFRQPWVVGETEQFCTCSIGTSEIKDGENGFAETMRQLDMAVEYAKKSGKNCIKKYSKKIGDEITRHIVLERCMHKDIANGFKNFSVYYQPIINSKTKKIESCEALMRWNCEETGLVSPAEFIPMAERLGFIYSLGEFVLKEAALRCKKWVESGLEINININLSVKQLIVPDFIERINSIIDELNVPADHLIFEVTESLAIHDMKRMKQVLNSLTELGSKIALDDFGTGYSSLNCLKEMPLYTVKIDKSFVDDICENSNTETFVGLIISFSHDLSMKVCVEGVEIEPQFNILKKLGADVIQGYFFGRPMSAEEFESVYLTKKI